MTTLSNTLADLAERVKEAEAASAAAARTSADKALQAGALLVEAKAACRHGEWLPFLARAGMPERKAQRYMTLARSGIESDTVTDLGGIRGALEFLARWRLPEFEQALFISDPLREIGEQSVGRGIAYVWEDETHRGYFHVGMINGCGEDDEMFNGTRRPMKPIVETPGDRPIDTVMEFLKRHFVLPIAEWEIEYVSRRIVFPVMGPFLANGKWHEAA